jgi:NADH dehydrogenase [ubiquinone] 1 alpha subcomplex assembly factor 5
MAQCRFALRPDGLFLGAMLGGTTLQELRIACTLAQQERLGGVSPRVSPLAQVRDAGNLLTRAGLAIPTVDVDEIEVRYRDPLGLVSHLRRMGEGSGLRQRREGLPRDAALAAAALYQATFAGRGGGGGEEIEGAEEGGVPATFQVIYMTGWAPDPSQAGAARRGSATVSLADLAAAGIGGGGERGGEADGGAANT